MIHTILHFLSQHKPLCPARLFISYHDNDVIIGAMAYQITSLTIVYLTVFSGADQRTYQSSALLALCPRGRFIPRTNGQ